MKVNCVSCGHKIDLDDAYEDYEGQVKCYACNGLLEIRTQEGKIKSVQLQRISGEGGVITAKRNDSYVRES